MNVDGAYLSRLAEDDESAFHYLFNKYFPKLKYFIAHIVKSEEIAEELSQDVFVTVWEKRATIAQMASFSAYIYRIAKNLALNYLKRKYIEENYLSNYESSPFYGTEEEYIAKEIDFLIRLSVHNMPPQRKKVFEMSRFENKSNEEIAEELNLSKKTVENHLNLALKEIRKTISLFLLLFI